MEYCEYKKNEKVTCQILGIIFGIIIGVATGILFSLDLIPLTLNFIIIALIMSVISLAIILGSLFTANITEECNAFNRCICKFAQFGLVGSIGTLLSTTIALTIGVTISSLIAAIFVGLSALFFVIMIIAITFLLDCLIKKTCCK